MKYAAEVLFLSQPLSLMPEAYSQCLGRERADNSPFGAAVIKDQLLSDISFRLV